MSRAARLGLFILATLAILVSGIFIIGSKQYLFSSTYPLKTQFADVAGLAVGADVRVGGIHSGTIRSITLPHHPDGKVTVIADMDNKTREIIKQDSIATIETEGLVGDQYLAISFGSASGAELHPGDTLASQAPLAMSDLLKKANGMFASGQQAVANTAQTTANLNAISGKINSGQGTIGAMVNDQQLYNNLNQTSVALRETMVQAQTGVTDFQENMEAMKHNFFLRAFFKNRGYEDSAELTNNAIKKLPSIEPVKSFVFSAKDIFDKQDSTKLKNQKSMDLCGEYLMHNPFGFAAVVSTTSMDGDTQKDIVLSEVRALLVRNYLIENFGFDDSTLRTLGMGKQTDSSEEKEWGTVRILVYPAGSSVPPLMANTTKENAATVLDETQKELQRSSIKP
jgi:phospholipid/cholesterol/gamma-HCH transport system substrate-binding protein